MKKTLVALFLVAMMVLTMIPVGAAKIADGTMIYYEDFEGMANTTSTDATTAALGWRVLDSTEAYKDNTAIWKIEDGRLKVHNYTDEAFDADPISGGQDSYMLILESDDMWEVTLDNDFTIQWDMQLVSSGDVSRYIVLVTHYNAMSAASYASFHFRMKGYADFQYHFGNTWYRFDDKSNEGLYASDTDDTDSTPSIYKKLTGNDIDTSKRVCAGMNVRIRMQCPEAKGLDVYGPTVYMQNLDNGGEMIKVTEAVPEGPASDYYDKEIFGGYGVAIKAGGTINGWVDNIAIWTGFGDMPVNTDVTYEAPEYVETTEAPTTKEETTKAPEDDATKAPADDATNAPADDATNAPTDDATASINDGDSDGGCASVAAAGIALVAILGTALVLGKKH